MKIIYDDLPEFAEIRLRCENTRNKEMCKYCPFDECPYDTGFCPVCREEYEIDYEKPKFCKECGQALDWSDTE